MRNFEKTAMRTVKVKKSELIDKLQENREKHKREFAEAFQGYRDSLISAFQKRVEQARVVSPTNGVRHSIELDVPVDHTAEYDRALEMLRWEQEELIILSVDDFNCYVMDDFDWQRSFKAVHSTYANNAR